MITCRECGSDNVLREAAMKCRTCRKCLAMCDCLPVIDSDGVVQWEPAYTALADYVCQSCGIVGDVHNTKEADHEYDAA